MTYFCPLDGVFLVYYRPILMATAGFSLLMGLFLILRPRQAIDIQIMLYRLINWKIEPIRLKWEIVSTRLMGAVALICSFVILVLIFKKYQ